MKFDILPIEEWGLGNKNVPLGIFGPCSAETEEQVMETARDLVHRNVHVFRAGVWKPRTRPGTFEGVGEIGLKWLERVKKETGMKVATEVASVEHAKIALNYDIDVLWIGARSTANPFSVQEIAEVLSGSDRVVLVKNPMNPDLDLWMGALERFNKCGIRKLGAIHRGFTPYVKTKYRNIPQWQVPIELKHRHPELPIICDPSHIGGNRDLILPLAQTALNLEFDGLMIESHCNPGTAWSDASQQVTPARAKEITEVLELRQSEAKGEAARQLAKLRLEIDELDSQLITLLGARMKIAEQIGEVKKSNNTAILQSNRWYEVLKKGVVEGQAQGLSEEFITTILETIHQESIEHQNRVMNA